MQSENLNAKILGGMITNDVSFRTGHSGFAFFSGVMPTKEEFIANSSALATTYSDSLDILYIENYLSGIGANLLGSTSFYTPEIIKNEENVTIAFEGKERTNTHWLDGDITWCIVTAASSTDLFARNGKQLVLFVLSVGLLGSGADIELPTVSWTSEGFDSMLNVSINTSIAGYISGENENLNGGKIGTFSFGTFDVEDGVPTSSSLSDSIYSYDFSNPTPIFQKGLKLIGDQYFDFTLDEDSGVKIAVKDSISDLIIENGAGYIVTLDLSKGSLYLNLLEGTYKIKSSGTTIITEFRPIQYLDGKTLLTVAPDPTPLIIDSYSTAWGAPQSTFLSNGIFTDYSNGINLTNANQYVTFTLGEDSDLLLVPHTYFGTCLLTRELDGVSASLVFGGDQVPKIITLVAGQYTITGPDSDVVFSEFSAIRRIGNGETVLPLTYIPTALRISGPTSVDESASVLFTFEMDTTLGNNIATDPVTFTSSSTDLLIAGSEVFARYNVAVPDVDIILTATVGYNEDAITETFVIRVNNVNEGFDPNPTITFSNVVSSWTSDTGVLTDGVDVYGSSSCIYLSGVGTGFDFELSSMSRIFTKSMHNFGKLRITRLADGKFLEFTPTHLVRDNFILLGGSYRLSYASGNGTTMSEFDIEPAQDGDILSVLN